jgi:hypothetical protein
MANRANPNDVIPLSEALNLEIMLFLTHLKKPAYSISPITHKLWKKSVIQCPGRQSPLNTEILFLGTVLDRRQLPQDHKGHLCFF